MNQTEWLNADWVSAGAAVVTAFVAVGAAYVALRQYVTTNRLSEIQTLQTLRSEINGLTEKIRATNGDQDQLGRVIDEFLELCEIYAGARNFPGHFCFLPGMTKSFIEDFLKYDLVPLAKDVDLVRERMRTDPKRPNHYRHIREFCAYHGVHVH